MADTIVVYNQNEPVVVTIPPPDYNVIDISAGLTITIIGGEGGTGATNFLQLTDTPSTYTGSNGKLLSVSGSAITFVEPPTGDGTVTSVNTIEPIDGNVTIDTDDVEEGSINLYFTDERVTSSPTVSNNSQYVSNIITGGGLNSSGGYTANTGANYIHSATSLNSADTLLDTALKAEADRAMAAEAANAADIAQNASDIAANLAAIQSNDGDITSLQNNITAEASARIAADDTLQSNIDALTSLSLTDTPSTYGTAGQVLVVNGNADGLMWATNGSTVTAGVSFVNDIEGSVTIESGNENATVSESGSTITIEVKPQQITETVKNVSGGQLDKGTPLHITASSGNTSNVVAANANASVALECHYVLNEDLANEGVGEAILIGFINNVVVPDASAFSNGDEVWLADGGGFTTTRPTGAGTLIQQIGVVLNVNTTNNNISGIVFGNAVKEDLPNLTSGYTWIGDANAYPQEYNLQGLVDDVNSLTGEVGTNTGAIADLVAADATITGDVDALTTRVTTAETNIASNSTNISSNTTAITNEASARAAADTQLQANIDAEAAARAAADTTLQTNIDTETTNRQNADNNLNTSITANTNSINAIKDRVFYPDGGDDKVTLKPSDATVKIDIDGDGDVIEFTAGNVKSTSISSAGVSTKELTINNGTADVFSLPTSDGSADQVLTTNGSGTVTWTNKSSSNDISISGLSAAGDYDSKAERWLFGTGTTSAGRLFYLSSTGAWAATDASAVSTAKGMLGVAVGTAPATNGMITRGFVRLTADTGGNVGDPVYMSETAESITNTPPSTSGAVVRVMGYKVAASIIYFNPSPDYFTVE